MERDRGSGGPRAGDTFVVHMDREALNDYPLGARYDVTVTITTLVPDREIAWTVRGRIRPQVRARLRVPARARPGTAGLSRHLVL